MLNEHDVTRNIKVPLSTQLASLSLSTVRMAERSKALRSGRSPVFRAWVRIPLLTHFLFFLTFFNSDSSQAVKKSWFHWVSNPGPLACEASVITTTLWNHTLLSDGHHLDATHSGTSLPYSLFLMVKKKTTWSLIKRNASAGNRTRAARVAGEHSTTEPPMLVSSKINDQ